MRNDPHQQEAERIVTVWATLAKGRVTKLDRESLTIAIASALSRAGEAAAGAERAKVWREAADKVEQSGKPGPGGIDITGGIPSEVYVAIGRERYDNEYQAAQASADAVRRHLASWFRQLATQQAAQEPRQAAPVAFNAGDRVRLKEGARGNPVLWGKPATIEPCTSSLGFKGYDLRFDAFGRAGPWRADELEPLPAAPPLPGAEHGGRG